MSELSKYRLVPDWTLPEGEKVKQGTNIRIHPYELISFTHKKWGLEKACSVAATLVKDKYDKVFDNVEITFVPAAKSNQ